MHRTKRDADIAEGGRLFIDVLYDIVESVDDGSTAVHAYPPADLAKFLEMFRTGNIGSVSYKHRIVHIMIFIHMIAHSLLGVLSVIRPCSNCQL